MEINVLDAKGKVSGKANLSEAISTVKPNKHLLHEVVTAYLANQRQGTHSTLTRGFVNKSGKKPWKQKHTGRARAGRASSPLWRGGGIIFGPHPRSYRRDIPQAKIKAALTQAISIRAQAGDLVVAEAPKMEKAKTKSVIQWLKTLALPQKSLLVTVKKDPVFSLASRNLVDFEIMEWKNIHPYQIMNFKKVILTPEVASSLS